GGVRRAAVARRVRARPRLPELLESASAAGAALHLPYPARPACAERVAQIPLHAVDAQGVWAPALLPPGDRARYPGGHGIHGARPLLHLGSREPPALPGRA